MPRSIDFYVATMLVLLGYSTASWAEYITPNVSGCLNIRSYPRSGNVKTCLSSGSSLKVVKTRGNWAKVSGPGVQGWVYQPMTRSISTPQSTYITPSVNSCLNFRSGPGRSKRACLSKGTKMKLVAKRGNWVKVELDNGRKGWVYKRYTRDYSKSTSNRWRNTASQSKKKYKNAKKNRWKKKRSKKNQSKYTSKKQTAIVAGDASVWRTQISDRSSLRCHKRETNPLKCLACNAHFEAAIEPRKGRMATHYVVFNRVASPHYPNDICKVVYQRMQFSWANSGAKRISGRKFKKAQREAEVALNQFLKGRLDRWNLASCSTHYVNPRYASRASLRWRRKMRRLGNIHRHTFYRMRGHKCFDGSGPGRVRLAKLTNRRSPKRQVTSSWFGSLAARGEQ